jgi:hypothetical protein
VTEDNDDFTVDSLLVLCFQGEIANADPYFATKAKSFLDGNVDAVSARAIREYHAAARDLCNGSNGKSSLSLRAAVRACALEAAYYYGKLDNLDKLNKRGMTIEGVREQYKKGLAVALTKGKSALKEYIGVKDGASQP